MSEDLFAIAPDAQARLDLLDGKIPVIEIDGIFQNPRRVRQTALGLPYGPGTAHYPGRIARYPADDPSLGSFLRKVIGLVDREYLPRLPPTQNGTRLTRVRNVDTDFAITDFHPSELDTEQRKPHVDFVPVFGLIYLNEEERGGTLFFKTRSAGPPANPPEGYPTADFPGLEVAGRIEGRFNRLAIYPGFILHTGEIGQWIEGEERFRSPRLTQRIVFFF